MVMSPEVSLSVIQLTQGLLLPMLGHSTALSGNASSRSPCGGRSTGRYTDGAAAKILWWWGRSRWALGIIAKRFAVGGVLPAAGCLPQSNQVWADVLYAVALPSCCLSAAFGMPCALLLA